MTLACYILTMFFIFDIPTDSMTGTSNPPHMRRERFLGWKNLDDGRTKDIPENRRRTPFGTEWTGSRSAPGVRYT
ncbi:hypothetical protein J27TS7_50430 [Paenibacillus dendritiformis]|nr:hypothetical protein J27TS7_50430 [Paenibacillus dendritiformis]